MRPLFPEPFAKEAKPSFAQIPPVLLLKIEDMFSEKILAGSTAYGGFSAAAGFIITFKSGRKVFAKGSHPKDTAHGTQNLRQEIRVYADVPVLHEISPRYLGFVQDDDEDGWMLGFWEYIEPAGKLVVEDMIEALVRFQRDGAVNLKSATEQNYISLFLNGEKKWHRIDEEAATAEKFICLFSDAAAGRQWLRKNIGTLCALQDKAVEGTMGLLHGDLRADNFLCGKDKTFVIDWPNACRGALIFDAMFLFANLESLGLCNMESAFAIFEKKGGVNFSTEQKSIAAAHLSGFFADQAYRAVPEKLPRLRWMQRGMLCALLLFLSRLGIIDSPPKMRNNIS